VFFRLFERFYNVFDWFWAKNGKFENILATPLNWSRSTSSISRNLMLAFFRRKSTFFDPNSCFFDFLSVFTTFLTGFGLQTGSLKIYWELLKMRHTSPKCTPKAVQYLEILCWPFFAKNQCF